MNPNEAIEFLPKIGPEAWAIYCYLVSLANGELRCSPSYEMIQAGTGLARGTIAKYLSSLRSSGLVGFERRFSASTVYSILTISPQYGLAIPLTTTTINTTKRVNSSSKSLISPQCGLMGSMDDVGEAFYVFAQTTGLLAFNSRTEQADIKRLGAIIKQNGVEKSIEFLKPFFEAWCKRVSANTGKPYSRTTTGWLDWAIGGEIPPEWSNGNGAQKSKGQILQEQNDAVIAAFMLHTEELENAQK